MWFMMCFMEVDESNKEQCVFVNNVIWEDDMGFMMMMKVSRGTQTPGHLKQVICRILRTVHQKMTQIRVIHKKDPKMTQNDPKIY